jgi:hypothetical protein
MDELNLTNREKLKKLEEFEKSLPLWDLSFSQKELERTFEPGYGWNPKGMRELYAKRLAEAKKQLVKAVKKAYPSVALEWCLPIRINQGSERVPCGDSYEDPGQFTTRDYCRVEYRYGTLNADFREKANEQRRMVLGVYINEAKTNPRMREAVIKYSKRIKDWLR